MTFVSRPLLVYPLEEGTQSLAVDGGAGGSTPVCLMWLSSCCGGSNETALLPSWFRSGSGPAEDPGPQPPRVQQPSLLPVAPGWGWSVLASRSESVQLAELQLRSQAGEALM